MNYNSKVLKTMGDANNLLVWESWAWSSFHIHYNFIINTSSVLIQIVFICLLLFKKNYQQLRVLFLCIWDWPLAIHVAVHSCTLQSWKRKIPDHGRSFTAVWFLQQKNQSSNISCYFQQTCEKSNIYIYI